MSAFTILLALAAAVPALASPLSTSYDPASHGSSRFTIAPLVEGEHPHGSIPDSYIVMLKKGSNAGLLQNHLNFLQGAHASATNGHGITHVYGEHMPGYAGRFSNDIVQQIRTMPEVAHIERDQIVRTQNHTIQKGAPWGLARISHRKRLTFSTFTKYEYENQGGHGVNVYVIDTGINVKHVEFEGRAHWGKTIPQNDEDLDGNGHGTHCAGTIASKKYGVAKQAHVIAVKVLGSNGSGSMSDVVGGVSWAAEDASKKKAQADAEYRATGKRSHKGSVANMSLGGGKSRALDDAVNAAVEQGLHFAVAAGNDNRDACSFSPAAAELAVTVGASTLGDERAYFSNHGKCVDVFAPGLNILSTWIGSEHAVNTISGTSMASPHVAGLLAYLLSIHPSRQFAPIFKKDEVLNNVFSQPQQSIFSTPSSLYSVVHRALPGFVSSYLPAPGVLGRIIDAINGESDTISPWELTPKLLKKALIELSTAGVLADLPAQTVNLLVFNNATSP
ncbi:hypothetical protein HGRIS_001861 [Hohenbuehelia grisea]|uniref:Uncharacterized protein n=1 Tax=Hohenbuehelia grisea TaxID=104357 RepID=A0ABR3JJZ2_9AGAR